MDVAILVYDGIQSLDLCGPLEVLSLAERHRPGAYAVRTVAPRPGPVRTNSGLQIVPDQSIADDRSPIHTLIVAGGSGVRDAVADPLVVDWVGRAAARAERVASVCTGAFLLAAAGLLDGRRATTHWAACRTLARAHPGVEVDPDPIFVRDGHVFTSAGVTAGIDLTLALVESDLGATVALAVARTLVLYVRRPGGQRQFSPALEPAAAGRPDLRELQAHIAAHLDTDLSVPALAARLHVSERHLTRRFASELGTTPGAYVETVRVERARELLESGALPLAAVARICGFGTVETLRRSFARQVQVTPSEYRARFAA